MLSEAMLFQSQLNLGAPALLDVGSIMDARLKLGGSGGPHIHDLLTSLSSG